jgi:hypothetical protein
MAGWLVKAVGCLLAVSVVPAAAQAPNVLLLAKQQEAMKALAFLDGEWAGPAEALERTGTFKMTQTERAGEKTGDLVSKAALGAGVAPAATSGPTPGPTNVHFYDLRTPLRRSVT